MRRAALRCVLRALIYGKMEGRLKGMKVAATEGMVEERESGDTLEGGRNKKNLEKIDTRI